MQEGIPVGPGLMNQVRQIAQTCAAPMNPNTAALHEMQLPV
jgi:hypothetical protein